MAGYHEYLVNMPDGTIKQINPLSGTEVWSVPGRVNRPLANGHSHREPVQRQDPENYCDFCSANILRTPPEKSRMVIYDNNEYQIQNRLPPSETHNHNWEFRRVSNLFEIVTLDYWYKNYDYKLTENLIHWRDSYLQSEQGRNHVLDVINYKLNLMNGNGKQLLTISDDQKLTLCDYFFGGTHELIIAKQHFVDDTPMVDKLFSVSAMSPQQHYHYMKFTISSLKDIYHHNRYVRYVTVFQNWLSPAGASFDHLHRQLVGLDEWGTALEWEINKLRSNPNIYNELLVNFAAHTNRVIAENDHAIAFIAIGHRYPTIAIYSKSSAVRPYEMEDNELRGMSDLVHAMHATLGPSVSCNEEWYYTPRDSLDSVPWHVLIKLRVNTPAGFEGGTKIYINPYSPFDLRDKVVPALYELRNAGRINAQAIAEECVVQPNSLRYLENKN